MAKRSRSSRRRWKASTHGTTWPGRAIHRHPRTIDPGWLGASASRLIDEAGCPGAHIFMSGGLDEHDIDSLVRGGAPVDAGLAALPERSLRVERPEPVPVQISEELARLRDECAADVHRATSEAPAPAYGIETADDRTYRRVHHGGDRPRGRDPVSTEARRVRPRGCGRRVDSRPLAGCRRHPRPPG
jgi:hypothetical protein